MALTRRELLGATIAAGAALTLPAGGAQAQLKVDDNGLHVQDWFLDSFLDLKEDLSAAAEENKHLAVLFEQRGCPYCREMHKVNFAIAEITDYIKKNFSVVQLNLRGDREVTDFDGKQLSEKALARRWRVNFTPTISFFPASVKEVEGKSGRLAEVFRMPGYFKPFHFISAFEYVKSGRYKDQEYQSFVSEKGKKLRAEGKEVKLW